MTEHRLVEITGQLTPLTTERDQAVAHEAGYRDEWHVKKQTAATAQSNAPRFRQPQLPCGTRIQERVVNANGDVAIPTIESVQDPESDVPEV